jgi:hypothetical protein
MGILGLKVWVNCGGEDRVVAWKGCFYKSSDNIVKWAHASKECVCQLVAIVEMLAQCLESQERNAQSSIRGPC